MNMIMIFMMMMSRVKEVEKHQNKLRHQDSYLR